MLANPNLRHDIKNYLRNAAAMRAAALVGFLLVSGVYTSEWAVWRHELFRSLTWLGVPLAFAVATPLSAAQRLSVGLAFVGGTALVALATLAQYFADPAGANAAISIGQNMQAITRIFHVHFGLMLSQSFFWGLLLVRHPLARVWMKALMLLASIVAALTLHILAYRTGLLVFYTGLVAYTVWLLLRGSVVLGIGLVLLLGMAPLGAYYTLDSVRDRVASTHYDIEQYQYEKDINTYSLSRRLVAVKTAKNIIQQHWLLGVGPADAAAAMKRQYSWRDFGLRPENLVYVHNEYLSAMLGGGLVGLSILLAILCWPLTQAVLRRNPYVCFFILTQATVMMVADILSLQIGLNLFVFGYGFLVVANERNVKLTSSPT